MLSTGLVSITFREFSPEKIVEIVKEAQLESIEWGGDVHVPHGDLKTAEKVALLTRRAGLKVADYGSYYRVGESETEGLKFSDVLATAKVLGAEVVRVWAGRKNSQDATAEYWKGVVSETVRIADAAEEEDVKISFEFHDGTLNNTAESSVRFLADINHRNVKTHWQPMHGAGMERNCQSIEVLMPWIFAVHTFHWWPTLRDKHLLAEGESDWTGYIEEFRNSGREIPFLLEFVKDGSVESFFADAATLKSWIGSKF